MFFIVIYTDRTGKIGRKKGLDHINSLVEVRFDKNRIPMKKKDILPISRFLFFSSKILSVVIQLYNLIILKEKK